MIFINYRGIVPIDDTLRDLALSVAQERKPHKMCLSVQDGINVTEILKDGYFKRCLQR